MSVIVSGGDRVAGNGLKSTHKRTGAGVGGWDADHGATVLGVGVHPATGNIYTGGALAGGVTTRMYDKTGAPQWTANHGATVNALAVDAAGNCYTAGAMSSGASARKIDSAGVEQWAADVNTKTMNAIAVGADGNIYVAGAYDGVTNSNCGMYDTDGNALWFRNVNANNTLYAIAADAAGNVYTGGLRSGALITTRKISASGATVWAKDHGDTVYCIAVDGAGNVYTGGVRSFATSNITTRKYNSAGVEQWGRDHGATVRGIAVDDAGHVYTTGAEAGGYTTRKYDPNGTLLLSFTVSGTGYCIALGPDEAVQIPAVSIKLALGVPTATAFVDAPGLAIKVALGVPTVTRPLAPPVGDGQTIYRLWFSTVSAMLQLPLRSFQFRRRRGDSSWLTLVSPHPSPAIAALMESSFGANIVLQSGLRDSRGVETLGEFLRGALTGIEHDRSPWSASATLTVRVAAVNETLQARTLEAVTDISMNDSGKRRVRCAKIDHRLRPGDTAIYSAGAFVVNALAYAAGPADTWMEVEE